MEMLQRALASWTPQLAPEIPHLHPRDTFDYDAGNFIRASDRFEIVAHQSQPPGFPFYVLMLRGLSSLSGAPQTGMVSLSLLFMIAGLEIFWKLVRQTREPKTDLAALIVLSFSRKCGCTRFRKPPMPQICSRAASPDG